MSDTASHPDSRRDASAEASATEMETGRLDARPGCLGGRIVQRLAALIAEEGSDSEATSTLGKAEAQDEIFPYRRKDYLLTKGERAFFDVLAQAVDHDRFHLFAKVRLGDLLRIEKGTGRYQSYFNRIQSKHVDFLLCDRANVRPVLAIELDDHAHRTKSKTRERDDFVDRALDAAGLPLLRIRAAATYDAGELRRAIAQTCGS